MKKWISMLLSVALLWSLAGCGSGSLVLSQEPREYDTSKNGIYISVEDLVTEDGMSVLSVIWHNETKYEAVYGVAYTIQRTENGDWVDCQIADPYFIDLAYILEPVSTQMQSYAVSKFFDVSKAGTYRIAVECTIQTDDNPIETVQMWAEFTIMEEKETSKDKGVLTTQDQVQYVRTNGGAEGIVYPYVKVVHTRQELDDYYQENRENFDLERKDKVYADTTIGFLDACDKYDDVFFEKNTLLLIVLEEGSGSIKHNVRQVFSKNGFWSVYIDTVTPEAGTCDMAQWHILVELSQKDSAMGEENVAVYLDQKQVLPREPKNKK